MRRDRQGRLSIPVARPPAPEGKLNTPCHACPKIPTDAPEAHWRHAEDLSERNIRVLRHYRECRAVGHFPDDPLVRRHAAIIRRVEDARGPEARLLAKMDLILSLFVRKR